MKINNTLYFDHQASTPTSEHVLREMHPFFRDSCANPHSVDHALGWKSSYAVDKASEQIARMIGADSDEMVFTSGATEANNQALLGLARRATIKKCKRKRVLLGAAEHKCVLTIGRILQEQYDVQIDLLPVDKHGQILISSLEKALSEDVLAVSIMAVNNEIGTIQDIARLSSIIKPSGAIFHCDAAQAPLAMDMHDLAQHVDMLSLSGHKMYGPKGIGALYIRRDLQNEIEPLIYGGGQQNGLRSGTLPTPLCVGMGAATQLFSGNVGLANREELRQRRDRFVDMLLSLPWNISLNGPNANSRHPGNANILFRGFSAKDILSVLQPNVAASSGSACTSGITEPSHVLRVIGLSGEDADASIRFSLGFDTSDNDVDEAVFFIKCALEKLSV